MTHQREIDCWPWPWSFQLDVPSMKCTLFNFSFFAGQFFQVSLILSFVLLWSIPSKGHFNTVLHFSGFCWFAVEYLYVLFPVWLLLWLIWIKSSWWYSFWVDLACDKGNSIFSGHNIFTLVVSDAAFSDQFFFIWEDYQCICFKIHQKTIAENVIIHKFGFRITFVLLRPKKHSVEINFST